MLIVGYVRRRENFVAAATAFEKIHPQVPYIFAGKLRSLEVSVIIIDTLDRSIRMSIRRVLMYMKMLDFGEYALRF